MGSSYLAQCAQNTMWTLRSAACSTAPHRPAPRQTEPMRTATSHRLVPCTCGAVLPVAPSLAIGLRHGHVAPQAGRHISPIGAGDMCCHQGANGSTGPCMQAAPQSLERCCTTGQKPAALCRMQRCTAMMLAAAPPNQSQGAGHFRCICAFTVQAHCTEARCRLRGPPRSVAGSAASQC